VASTFDLVVTDLDGSLWSAGTTVHPLARAAWRVLESRSIRVLAATGRRISSTREPLLAHGWTVPAVMLNGSIGIDFASGERFHRCSFTPEAARAVLGAFRSVDLDPCIYVDDDDIEVYIGEHPSTHPEHLRSLGSTKRVADLDTVVEESHVLAFGIIGRPINAMVPIEAEVRSIAQPMLDKSYDLDGAAFTVAALGTSKWSGVVAYCRRHGLDPERVLAIGDGPNDLDLLDHAAVAVSFEGANPAAIALADYVLPPVSDGGWGGIVELLDRPIAP
jgi:hypothetical protein